MPKTRQAPPWGGTTPVPNFLLDRVMPRLTDTEWRVLCVIVRQTFGWHLGPGKRKQSDWLSHYQLKRRTGRQSAAVSRAIDRLVKRGLITVRDSHERLVSSTAARRRSKSHLLFSLHSRLTFPTYQRRIGFAQYRSSKTENNKTNPDKRKQQHRREPTRIENAKP